MNLTNWRLAVASSSIVLVSLSVFARAEEKGDAAPQVVTRETIGAYRTWHQVNSPTRLDPVIATMCKLPYTNALTTPSSSVPAELPESNKNPHVAKFIAVYVNDVGLLAMVDENPSFPVGSIVVKEKLPGSDRNGFALKDSPELLTVMVKREAGYDADHGDWEYLVLDGAATKIEGRGKLESCRSCHESQASNDFVFRDYLPADVRARIRIGIVSKPGSEAGK